MKRIKKPFIATNEYTITNIILSNSQYIEHISLKLESKQLLVRKMVKMYTEIHTDIIYMRSMSSTFVREFGRKVISSVLSASINPPNRDSQNIQRLCCGWECWDGCVEGLASSMLLCNML